ncbi:MAG TPA: PIN domain-containing protein [Ramlibacter sp.]|nr:PIN domain-containing protein [Ramlibacter sp.]
MRNPLVLDTNVVLDLFVFADKAALPLKELLDAGEVQWLATPPMRVELERVLEYPHIVGKLAFYGVESAAVLESFDHHARLVEVAAKAPVTCKDGDDQKFIDLALEHGCPLLSKDAAVLSLKKRLAVLGVTVEKALTQAAFAAKPSA